MRFERFIDHKLTTTLILIPIDLKLLKYKEN